MSHPPTAGRGVRPGTESETELSDDGDIEQLLGTLEDPDCRAIIEETSSGAYSAGELSERCDLPLSTTYRKVDTLTEVGLFEEQIRLCRSGKHTSEYVRRIDDVWLSLTGDHIDIAVSDRSDAERPTPPLSVLAGAD